MATRNSLIKGITIEIDGDVTKLNKALSDVNSTLRTNQSSLSDLDRLLKLDPGNTELLQQKFDLLSGSIEASKSKLETLRTASEQALEKLSIGDMTQEEFDALQREIAETESKLKGLEDEFREFGSVGAQHVAAIGGELKKVGGKITDVGETLTKGVTVPVAAGLGFAAKEAISFESAMTGVMKTNDELVDANGNVIVSYDDLGDAVKRLSTETASTKEEIAGVMEVAGQLSVGTGDLVGFTETMIKLGDSTNLTAEEAATSIAKMANVINMTMDEADNLGSSLVALGNNFATDEQSIMNMATRLSGAGAQIGLTGGEILGLATALSSVGIQAEMGGSAFSKAMIKMQVATETGYERVKQLEQQTGMTRRELELMASNNSKGFKELAQSLGMTSQEMNDIIKSGKDLENFADVAGMQVEDFVWLFRNDAPAAIQAFISGLGDVEGRGESTIQMLQDMGFTEVRLRDTLTRLANASGLVTDAVAMGNAAWAENTALTEEAEKRYDTTESRLHQLKESLTNLGIEVGEIILPVVKDMVEALKGVVEWLNSLDPKTKEIIVKIAAISALIGPLLIGIGSVVTSIGTIMEAGPKLLNAFNLMGQGISNFTTFLSRIPLFSGSAISSLLSLQNIALAAADALLVMYDVQKLSEAAAVYNEAQQTHTQEQAQALDTYANLYTTKGKEIADQWAMMAYEIDTTGMSMDQAQQALAQKVDSYWDDVPQSMWDGFKQGWAYYFEGGGGGGLPGLLGDAFTGAVDAVKRLLGISSPSTVFSDIGSNTIQGFLNGLQSAWGTVTSFLSNAFSNLINSATTWGSHFASGIANGINSAIGFVQSAASSVASAISNLLHFTRPDEGPLKEYESWMPDFMKGLARGIENNKALVSNAISGLAGDVNTGMQISGQQALQSNAGLQQGISAMTALMAQYLPYLPQLAQLQVVLDSGPLVGSLTPLIDTELGSISHSYGREVAF